MINKYINVKNKTCKEFNSEKNGVNKVNKNQQKIPILVKNNTIGFLAKSFLFYVGYHESRCV